MSTLLLRFAAPLQSWGTESKYDIRKTGREPSKSGVVGFLAAALGRRRDADLSDLNALTIGVRADREGQPLVDFHMARAEKSSYVTYRHYLSDAVFLVAVSSDDEALMIALNEAVLHPAFPLFLGRRSCPPTLPVSLGLRGADVREALCQEPPLVPELKEKGGSVRLVLDCGMDVSCPGRIRDVPLSFSPLRREYTWRSVRTETIHIGGALANEHNAMAELG